MIVIKIGGNELDDPAFVAALTERVAALRPVPVLVHGGGKEVGQIQQALGDTPRFVAGMRVTTPAALAAAEMVLCGLVSTRLVAALNAAGADALGMSGVDRGLIRVEPQTHPDGDLGRVGRPVAVRGAILRELLAANVLPVLAPVSLGPAGPYNVNADEAAGAVAAAVGASEVVFVTNVPGVLGPEPKGQSLKVKGQSPQAEESGPLVLLPRLTAAEVAALINDGTIHGGMIPKVRAALAALAAGVGAARITNLAGLGDAAAGTVVVS